MRTHSHIIRSIVCARVSVEEEPVEVGQSHQFLIQRILVRLVQLESPSPAQETPVLEHLEGVRMQCPVRALSRSIWSAWHLDEAVVEAEVVSQRVLWTERECRCQLVGQEDGGRDNVPASVECSCGSRESGP